MMKSKKNGKSIRSSTMPKRKKDAYFVYAGKVLVPNTIPGSQKKISIAKTSSINS